jgi:hypothetical protein
MDADLQRAPGDAVPWSRKVRSLEVSLSFLGFHGAVFIVIDQAAFAFRSSCREKLFKKGIHVTRAGFFSSGIWPTSERAEPDASCYNFFSWAKPHVFAINNEQLVIAQ